jgi:zinc protease
VPVVALQIWIPAGAAAEPAPLAGAAHLLEHLVFRGAGEWEGSELMAAAEAIGADLNAWTSVEQTAFHLTLPAEHVVEGLRMLWALVFQPWLRDADLEAERPVVLEELRGCEDDPTIVVAEALQQRLYGDHPYGRSVLGTADSVAGISADDLRRFHQARYRPEAAVLAVAGPVDLDALESAVAELAGPPVNSEKVRSALLSGRVPISPGLHLLPRPFRDLRLELAAPIPGPSDPSLAALDVLAVAVGGGAASRLSVRLRQELDLVLGCSAALEVELQGGAFVVSLAARPGRLPAALAAVQAVLGELASQPLGEGELERARAIVRADRLHERETVDGRAGSLGWNTVHHNDPDAARRYEAAIAAVDAAAVQAAAARWLRAERTAVVVMGPGEELARAQPTLEACWEKGWGTSTVPRPARASRPGPVAFTGPAGLRVLVEHCESDELVGISVIGRGGSLADPADLAGACLAWSEVVERGAGDLDAMAFAAAVEAQSGNLAAWSARNSSGVQASMPRDAALRRGGGLDLVAELLLRPHLAAEEVARTRADLTEGRALLEDDPGALAWELAWSRLFPQHPWGRPEAGTRASIARLTRGRLRAVHRRVVTGHNLCLGVVGCVDPDQVRAAVERVFSALPAGPAVPLRPPGPAPRPGRLCRRVPRGDAPAQVTLAWRAVGRDSPEWATALVLDGLLGGSSGLGGRLFQVVREDAGLAYDVGSSLEGGLGGGALLCSASTDPARADETAARIRDVVRGLATTPVDHAELDRVRRGLVAATLSSTQRAVSRADQLAGGLCYRGRGDDWRERLQAPLGVGADQVQALAARLLRDDVAVEVQVLPGGAVLGSEESSPSPRD